MNIIYPPYNGELLRLEGTPYNGEILRLYDNASGGSGGSNPPPSPGLAYLLDYTTFAHTRDTPAFGETEMAPYLRPYPPNTIRKHPTQSHTYLFEPIVVHYVGDNIRGLANRTMTEASFEAHWTATNCVPDWFSLISTIWTPHKELDPTGNFTCEMVVSANGDATLVANAANGGGLNVKQHVVSVYIKLATGVSAPVNGAQLIASTNAGATVVTKNIVPTTSWARYFLYITPAVAPNNKIVITLKLPNATAGDRVIWALPEVVANGNNTDMVSLTTPYPYINLGSDHITSDGDTLTIPAASIPAAMLGNGGSFGFTWIPSFDSGNVFGEFATSPDVTFFSCGDLYREILCAPARDGSIWIRADNNQLITDPFVKSNPITFLAGDVISVSVSPTKGKISVAGARTGNGVGPDTWAGGFQFNAGFRRPYTWASNDMLVGDRVPVFGYARGSHMGAGYISEPYAIDDF